VNDEIHKQDDGDFRPGERQEIRLFMELRRASIRFWSKVRQWGAWVAALMAGIVTAIQLGLGEFVSRLFGR